MILGKHAALHLFPHCFREVNRICDGSKTDVAGGTMASDLRENSAAEFSVISYAAMSTIDDLSINLQIESTWQVLEFVGCRKSSPVLSIPARSSSSPAFCEVQI